MDRSRREFLKKAFWLAGGGAAGFAYLNTLGIGPKEAKAIGIESHATTSPSGGGLVDYSAWNETTELVNNSAVWLMESGAASNETGVDSRATPLTLDDLVGTQFGGLAAASGSPPTRLFDGTGNYMTWTPTAYDIISNGTSVWTLIIKGIDITEAQTAGHAAPIYMYEGTDGHTLGNYQGIWQIWETTGKQLINTTTAVPLATSGTVYACWWADGTYVRCGWTVSGSGANGQPTKYSDFPANQRLSATDTCIWPNGSFTSALYGLMRFNLDYTAGKICYFLMSDICLFDNAS